MSIINSYLRKDQMFYISISWHLKKLCGAVYTKYVNFRREMQQIVSLKLYDRSPQQSVRRWKRIYNWHVISLCTMGVNSLPVTVKVSIIKPSIKDAAIAIINHVGWRTQCHSNNIRQGGVGCAEANLTDWFDGRCRLTNARLCVLPCI